MKTRYIALSFALTLCACANQLDPTTEVWEAQALYNTAVSGELAWISLAKPNAGALAAVQSARLEAYADLEPAVKEVEAGVVPSSAEVLALETAITVFQNAIPVQASATQAATPAPSAK